MNHLCIFILGALLAMHFAILPSVDATDFGCNSGFSAFKGHCYMAVKERVTQSEAVAKCFEKNSTLASIHSEAEFDFVMGLLLYQSGYFIGLKLTRHPDNEKLISCYFTDGTPFDYGECKTQSGKKSWGESGKEPNNFNGNETCVGMLKVDSKSGYYDLACTQEVGYVCKH